LLKPKHLEYSQSRKKEKGNARNIFPFYEENRTKPKALLETLVV
jgi:hypothetical protein